MPTVIFRCRLFSFPLAAFPPAPAAGGRLWRFYFGSSARRNASDVSLSFLLLVPVFPAEITCCKQTRTTNEPTNDHLRCFCLIQIVTASRALRPYLAASLPGDSIA